MSDDELPRSRGRPDGSYRGQPRRSRSCSERQRRASAGARASSRWSSARRSRRSPLRLGSLYVVFTGIVRESARTSPCVRSTAARRRRLEVDAPATAPARAVGDSVAINGVCLTAVDGRRRAPRVRRRPGDARRARRSAGSSPAPRSTSSRRCGPASRSAATTSRATSTASAASARSSRRATAPVWSRRARRSSSATASRRARSPSTASRSRSPALDDAGFAVALIPHTLDGDDARRARARRRGQPRGRRAREVRRAAARPPSGLRIEPTAM